MIKHKIAYECFIVACTLILTTNESLCICAFLGTFLTLCVKAFAFFTVINFPSAAIAQLRE